MIDALTDQNNALNMEVASLKDALEVSYSDTGYTRMPKERIDQNLPEGQATTLGLHPTHQMNFASFITRNLLFKISASDNSKIQ